MFSILFTFLLYLILKVLALPIIPFVCFLRFNDLTFRRLFTCSFTVCLIFTYRMCCLFAVCLFSGWCVGFLFLYLHLLFVLLISGTHVDGAHV